MPSKHNDVRFLLIVLIGLFVLFLLGVLWWWYNDSKEDEQIRNEVAGLTAALDKAHEQNPEDVPSPEEVIDDPIQVISGKDGRDGRDGRDGEDGRTPTEAEVSFAVERWLALNVFDQPDPDDPEVQDVETQDGEVQDPELNDPDPDDPDPDDPEIQDPEIQDDEIQDPESQDPEIDDPDPGIDEFRFEFGIANRRFVVVCNDADGDQQFSCVATETKEG